MTIKKMLLLAACLGAAPQAVLAESATLPAIAYQACADLQAGDVVEFTNKTDGDFVGVCQIMDGKLVAVPVSAPTAKPSQPVIDDSPGLVEPAK